MGGSLCNVTALAPKHTFIILLTIRFFTAGDQLVVPRGVTHISLPLQEYNRGSGRKRGQTNKHEQWLTQEQKGSMQHYNSDSIYGLTLAWITSENSTKQLECRHLDSIFFAGPYLMLPRLSTTVSGVDCPCPCPVANCCQLLFPTNSLLASRYLFRPRRDFKSKNPLSGFAPKQTKESSAWRATHIVLQLSVRAK